MITYLLKVTLCSGCLLLFYRLVLEREKMFRFNRFYLLSSLLVSVVLPLVPIEIFIGKAIFSAPSDVVSLAEQVIPGRFTVPLVSEPALPTEFPWLWALGVGYLIIGSTLLFRFGKNIFRLVQRIRGSEVKRLAGVDVVLVDGPTLPHSFLTYVFLPKATYLQGTLEREVLDHERAHVRQWHSLDILFVEILKILFWFNPAFYFFRNAIALNHEFLADEAVLRTYRDVPAYQYLLLQKATSLSNQLFTSQFNYSFTKKRFVMMNKHTSRTRTLLTQSAVLPLMAVIFFAFSDLTLAQIAPPPPPAERAPPPPPVERTASSDAMKEYNALVDKYIDKTKDDFVREFTETDGDKMVALLATMSPEQRAIADYKIQKTRPLFRAAPTEVEYEKYKNPKEYGVWIDGKKVPNTALDKYKPTDFSQVYISRLTPRAVPKTGIKYKYQLDLMTNAYYENYRKKTLENPKKFMIWRKKQY